MRTHRVLSVPALCLALPLLGAGCGDSPVQPSAEPSGSASPEAVIDPGDGGQYAPAIDAADFVDTVNNPYFPLLPGSRWVYDGTSDGETEQVVVVVTGERRTISGISATVVRDTVTIAGEVVEDTYDWYAQDRDGNVWYLGEAVQDFENGQVVSTAGSWEAGVDGAYPGIVMKADPKVGDAYRQEYYRGEAEDLGEVLEIDTDRVLIQEWNPLEPEVVEQKAYERGVGLVGEEKVRGAQGAMTLTSFTAN